MNKNLIAIIALIVVPLSGLAVDVYVPSLPYIATFFGVSSNLSQSTITIYLAGYAISQLIAGIVCDIFGRKISTVVPLAAFSLISLCIVLAHDIYIVLFLRFLQGFMVGFFAVAQRAIIIDIFKEDVKKLQSMANYLTIVWSIGPVIAPVIGGYLQHLFSWQANFIFLLSYSTIALILVILFVPETLVTRGRFDMGYLYASYSTILRTKGYNLGVLCSGLLYLINISFSTVGAFIVERQMGYSPVVFGYCALLLGLFWFAGQMLNKILYRYSVESKLRVASSINIVIVAIAFIWSIFSFNIVQLILPLLALNICSSIVFGNYFVRNSTMFPQFAGNAGALQGAGLVLISSLGGTVINKFVSTNSAMPLMITYVVIVTLCFFITRLIKFN